MQPFVRYTINNRIIERVQIEEEFSRLLKVMQEEKVRHVLELGFLNGGTALGFDEIIRDGSITSIDCWNVAEDYAKFLMENKAFKNDFMFIPGYSERSETINSAKQRSPFDMLFIDAGHTYDAVMQDYINYSPMVKQGGLIAFHDIRLTEDPITHKDGVERAYYSIAAGHIHREIILPYPDYLPRKEGFGIGLIYKS